MIEERDMVSIYPFRLQKVIPTVIVLKVVIVFMMDHPSFQELRKYCLIIDFIIRLSFLTKFINTGAERPLTEEDIGICPHDIRAADQYSSFKKYWDREMIRQSNKRSLALSLFRSSGPFLWILSIVLYIFGTQVSYITPLVLEQYSNDLDVGLISRRLNPF